jgi:hypothetical protein
MMFVGDSMPEDGVEVIYLAKRGLSKLDSRLSTAAASTRPRDNGVFSETQRGKPYPMESTSRDKGLTFESDIRPLFRERDRGAMREMFDLWSRDDVAENSQAILRVLESGAMPCDQPWPAEQVSLFQRWVEGGMPA